MMNNKMQAQITITVDLIPDEDGEDFLAWCEKHDCDVLGSDRRAWCEDYNTYLRDAIGVGESPSGEKFLVYREDLKQ